MGHDVTREFSSLFIALDSSWLAILLVILWWSRRRTALIVGLLAGALYFIVDYGIFYRLLGTRVVEGADPVWLLLWLSVSYGFTNFAWIWLLLSGDRRSVEWSTLIPVAWLAIALLSQSYGGEDLIRISRGTSAYHGAMALVMLVGYGYLIIRNIGLGDGDPRAAPILKLLAIGVGVQFAWESILLISGIRPASWQPIVVNSLIETNLGMAYIWLIHRWAAGRWPDRGQRVPAPGLGIRQLRCGG